MKTFRVSGLFTTAHRVTFEVQCASEEELMGRDWKHTLHDLANAWANAPANEPISSDFEVDEEVVEVTP